MALRDSAKAGDTHAAKVFLNYVDEIDKNSGKYRDPTTPFVQLTKNDVTIIINNLKEKKI